MGLRPSECEKFEREKKKKEEEKEAEEEEEELSEGKERIAFV